VRLTPTPDGPTPTGIVAITEYFCALAVPISEENTVDIRNVIVKSENNMRNGRFHGGFITHYKSSCYSSNC
jgi:hypothetical protein